MESNSSLLFPPAHADLVSRATLAVLAKLLESHPDRETAKGCLQILVEQSGAGNDLMSVRAFQRGAESLAVGEIEVDDDAVVSNGDDGGAYVQAWLWVSDEAAEGWRK